jgi:hypothetical protein
MDKLEKNHARFCAKYVKFVGVAFNNRKTREILTINGEAFAFKYPSSNDFKVGDVVYLAKRIPTVKGQPQKWEVHQIVLPELYWWYEYNERRTPKEKRVKPYEPMANYWFGRNRFIVTKL